MRACVYWVFTEFFRLYSKLFLILIVRGGKKRSGPSIYVANHPNVFDPMYLLPVLGERVTVLITEHAFQVPVFGSLLRCTRQIQVTSCGRDAYDEACKRLKHGESILLFPEGDCDSGKRILPFHTGAVRLALATHRPIIPIGIYLDPVKVWKRHTHIGNTHMVFTWYRYGWYGVTFGKELVMTGSLTYRAGVKSKTRALHRNVRMLARNSKNACRVAMLAGKRKVKRYFHSTLRFAYRFICFLLFTRIH